MATLLSAEQLEQSSRGPVEIEVPALTAWPLVLAFGFTLMFAGLLTSMSVSVLGVVLAVAGCVGWFREVFPHEHEETVPVVFEEPRIATEGRVVERVPVAPDLARAWLPLETYPVSAGMKGGLAGGAAMAVLACAYGVLKAGSIWYPINLLAAAVYYQSLKMGPAQLYSFHLDSLLIAPVLWSGLIYTMLGLLNPLLESHIDWYWFVASQVGFGLVAGLVVVRQSRMLTRENLPFAMRAGVEAPGIMARPESGEKH